jgi:hypothetical protein
MEVNKWPGDPVIGNFARHKFGKRMDKRWIKVTKGRGCLHRVIRNEISWMLDGFLGKATPSGEISHDS